MSRKSKNVPKLNMKLSLSPPRVNTPDQSPRRLLPALPTSPSSSCASLELNQEITSHFSNSPEAPSLILVGCPRCHLYVMVPENDIKCPKCKGTNLLQDFKKDNTTSTTTKN